MLTFEFTAKEALECIKDVCIQAVVKLISGGPEVFYTHFTDKE